MLNIHYQSHTNLSLLINKYQSPNLTYQYHNLKSNIFLKGTQNIFGAHATFLGKYGQVWKIHPWYEMNCYMWLDTRLDKFGAEHKAQ